MNIDLTAYQRRNIATFLRELADLLENPSNETFNISLTSLKEAATFTFTGGQRSRNTKTKTTPTFSIAEPSGATS